MAADRTSSKLHIPHPLGNFTLVGVLEQLEPQQPTNGRKIALILHGMMGHKDYLFQKRLASKLPFDSFRFDFRGNHESGGQSRYAGFADEVQDLVTVVAYLRTTYGYQVDMVVGHSRGSVVGMHWLCTSEEGKHVRALVNVSGRYRMHRIYDDLEIYKQEFETKGYYERNVVVARKAVVQKIYPHNLEEFSRWDSPIVWDKFPSSIDVLTIHGLVDKVVNVYDAIIYARAFGARTPGTHNLQLIEDGDHNLTGVGNLGIVREHHGIDLCVQRQDEIVECILDWWKAKCSGSLVTGVFGTGVRGKL